MTVDSRLPSLKAFIAPAMASARCPASDATRDPATGRPSPPWHIAQPDARARIPESVRLGAANAGAACCAITAAAATAAPRPSATTPEARHLLIESLPEVPERRKATLAHAPRGRKRPPEAAGVLVAASRGYTDSSGA